MTPLAYDRRGAGEKFVPLRDADVLTYDCRGHGRSGNGGTTDRHPHRTDGLGLVDTTAWYEPDAPAAWASRAETAREKGLAALIPFQLTRWFGDDFVANDLDDYAATCHMLGAADLREGLAGVRRPAAAVITDLLSRVDGLSDG